MTLPILDDPVDLIVDDLERLLDSDCPKSPTINNHNVTLDMPMAQRSPLCGVPVHRHSPNAKSGWSNAMFGLLQRRRRKVTMTVEF